MGRRYRRYTPEEDAVIIRRFRAATLATIARKIGRSPQGVADLVQFRRRRPVGRRAAISRRVADFKVRDVLGGGRQLDFDSVLENDAACVSGACFV